MIDNILILLYWKLLYYKKIFLIKKAIISLIGKLLISQTEKS